MGYRPGLADRLEVARPYSIVACARQWVMVSPVVADDMVDDPRDDDATEEDDEFRCVVCDETFEDQQSLERHGEDAHEGSGDHSKQP